MTLTERRWAGPAAAVLAFCLTLLLVSPPTNPPIPATLPTSAVVDGAATLTAHALLGLLTIAGLSIIIKTIRQRPSLRAQSVTRPSKHVEAA
jgi:hypothetical protein